ncbi:hypothetical protein NG798_22575 [Ancylothrix sp. C2]|uniref:hypothetical protein n=1 Tax=Ancylothrix sp. D3o TaxID=2953691 RepID=UPI0021BA92C8|nr:hypothetical protein [Ancylothrix sp. D3o]MCT7952586.1 hypothetical protein [Ancylothrix sp. D3o]
MAHAPAPTSIGYSALTGVTAHSFVLPVKPMSLLSPDGADASDGADAAGEVYGCWRCRGIGVRTMMPIMLVVLVRPVGPVIERRLVRPMKLVGTVMYIFFFMPAWMPMSF